MALANNHEFHLVACLVRGKSILSMKTNTNNGHPKFFRKYKDGTIGCALHAEMSVMRWARPGDKILVVRFSKAGLLTMAKPCVHCQQYMKKFKIKEVYYSDWDGNIVKMKIKN